MNIPPTITLVNFRASRTLLESFDRVCLLSGKTRTQVLSELMRQRVTKAGPRLVARLENDRQIGERLRTAVEGRSALEMADRPKEWSNAVLTRLKPFSSPDFDPVR